MCGGLSRPSLSRDNSSHAPIEVGSNVRLVQTLQSRIPILQKYFVVGASCSLDVETIWDLSIGLLFDFCWRSLRLRLKIRRGASAVGGFPDIRRLALCCRGAQRTIT